MPSSFQIDGQFLPVGRDVQRIAQGDITRVLEAFPLLERLDVRSGEGLELKPVSHASLRILRFETGGLPEGVARALGDSELPALEHLELWLGTPEYGGGATVNDVEIDRSEPHDRRAGPYISVAE